MFHLKRFFLRPCWRNTFSAQTRNLFHQRSLSVHWKPSKNITNRIFVSSIMFIGCTTFGISQSMMFSNGTLLQGDESKTVPLSVIFSKQYDSSINLYPTVVLVHGLDSAKDTWSSLLSKFPGNAIALDLRGHGESPLGLEENFTPHQLVTDIYQCLRENQVNFPIVLVGHSMGGRVVMRYAAEYPEDICTLVIEDMDIKLRTYNPIEHNDLVRRRQFTRSFQDWDTCMQTLYSFGYAKERVDDWKKYGRIIQREDGSIWSNINPMAQYLAIINVLASNDGQDAFTQLTHFPFPVHLWIAGIGSACNEESTRKMQSMLPNLQVTYFPNSSHSIHRNPEDEIIALLAKLASSKCTSKL